MLLQQGNKKLKNMLVYSHTPITGCLDCSECASTCYAVKSYRQYPNVKKSWDSNLDLVKNDLTTFKIEATKELLKTKKKVVRIHASGDFISQEYINAWQEIAEAFPEINFYTYTKSLDRFDYSGILKLNNVNIINSFINGRLNYGSHEYVTALVAEEDAFLCPATVTKDVTCGEGCDYCVTNNKVVFLQH